MRSRSTLTSDAATSAAPIDRLCSLPVDQWPTFLSSRHTLLKGQPPSDADVAYLEEHAGELLARASPYVQGGSASSWCTNATAVDVASCVMSSIADVARYRGVSQITRVLVGGRDTLMPFLTAIALIGDGVARVFGGGAWVSESGAVPNDRVLEQLWHASDQALQVLTLCCEAADFKEAFGASLMRPLVTTLSLHTLPHMNGTAVAKTAGATIKTKMTTTTDGDDVEDQQHCLVRRAWLLANRFKRSRHAATGIINLFKGSKSNKALFREHVDSVIDALLYSEDFFLQMQCVELLFRFSLLPSSREGATSGAATLIDTHPRLSPLLRASIPRLPCDNTLLDAIVRLLQHYHQGASAGAASRSAGPPILSFDVASVDVGTTAGPSVGEAVPCWDSTMVYFSPSLVVIMLPGNGGDNISLPYASIRSVKITKEQRLALRLSDVPVKLEGIMSVAGDDPASRDTLYLRFTAGTLKRLKDESPVHAWMIAGMRSSATTSSRHLPTLSRPTNGTMVVVPPVAGGDATSGARPAKGEVAEKGTSSRAPLVGSKRSRSTTHSAVTPASTTVGAPLAIRDIFASNATLGSAAVPATASCATTDDPHHQLLLGAQGTPADSVDMLSQLRLAIHDRVERRQKACQQAMADAVRRIQDTVDETRAELAVERAAYAAAVHRELADIVALENGLKERATAVVARLNAKLVDLQTLSQIAAERTQEAIATTTELDQLNDRADEHQRQQAGVIEAFETTMADRVTMASSRSDPLRTFASFLMANAAAAK